ncbi:MAG TPA: hypothetical protein VI792_00245, partial [Candidatus Eisenbacteria bacterium]
GARVYRMLRGPALEFTASGSATSAPVAEASGLKVLGSDINYIKPDAAALAGESMDPPWWPNLLYALSLALVGTAFAYRVHRERLAADRGYARRSRSSSLVRLRLRQAESLLRKHDEKGFHAELSRALLGYLGDRFNIDTHALTRDQLRAELARLEVPPEAVDDVLAIVDRCEVARFAPGAPEGRDPKSLFESARSVMGRI